MKIAVYISVPVEDTSRFTALFVTSNQEMKPVPW